MGGAAVNVTTTESVFNSLCGELKGLDALRHRLLARGADTAPLFGNVEINHVSRIIVNRFDELSSERRTAVAIRRPNAPSGSLVDLERFMGVLGRTEQER